jgi:hypothetical protein
MDGTVTPRKASWIAAYKRLQSDDATERLDAVLLIQTPIFFTSPAQSIGMPLYPVEGRADKHG